VKNLFDVKGLATRADRDQPRPAAGVARRHADRAAGSGRRRAGRRAQHGRIRYDFTGENVHDGPSRNPHDPTRMSGGSSGGSGSAVGGGLVRWRWGRTPTARSGCRRRSAASFGLKPTYGRLSRARSFPFVASLDHLGPFARSVADLALAYDAMQGPDADDAA